MNMRIGELADRAKVSQRTIHYYEELGLIKPLTRTDAGHRYYDVTTVERLEKIKTLKELGLSLEEISEVIDLYFEEGMRAEGKKRVIAILEKQLEDTDIKIKRLTAFKIELEKGIERIKNHLR